MNPTAVNLHVKSEGKTLKSPSKSHPFNSFLMLDCEPDCFNMFDGLLYQLQKPGHIENKNTKENSNAQTVCLHKYELSLFDMQNKQTQKYNNADTVKASCYIKET